MGESYEQGIEKAMAAMGASLTGREWVEWIVEAFLSAQPTIQWCKQHVSPPLRDEWDDGGFRNTDGSSRCAISFLMHEGFDDDYHLDCKWVEVRIVEQETP